ncbi:pilus assembly protein CpaE [Nakamurella panacisegetis]|uniref:Pilus assembly protein CpaE n=1 Tax=Nakamurella panacisegetis TaxID=1090615 RepID=A0A1H0HNJ2_9ACTN|nr:AAA family ATPase [Nakamurella panacisegetis]SDO20690.1 pilus assembly protein CpaE [Nakamurella panacisegetis]
MKRTVVMTTSAEFERRVRLAIGADSVESMDPGGAAGQPDGHRRAGDPVVIDAARLMVSLGVGEPPDVVVIGPDIPMAAALNIAAHIDQRHLPTSVVLANGVGPDEWLLAMQAGIRDVIAADAEVSDLRLVLDRAASAAAAQRHAALTTGPGGSRGRVIPVVSPKGGCGKTTVASNLAVGLAALAPHQTVIVDLDLQFGDIATALQLAPEQGIAQAVAAKDLDAMALKTFLTPHSTGLYSLCAPQTPAECDVITGEDVGRLIDLLAQEFRYVVIDTAPGLTEHTLAVLDRASDAVLVCGMDVPSIRGLHKELSILHELSLDGMTQHVLCNFADRHSGLTVKDVEAVIGRGVDLVIPRSKAVPLSTNRGVPLLQSRTRDAVTKNLQQLVALFQPQLKKAAGRAPRHRAMAR